MQSAAGGPESVKRRDFVKLGSASALGAAVRLRGQMAVGAGAPSEAAKADITLRIAPVTVELAPDRILSTIGYNGTSPGPILRMREGKAVTVDVINETDTPELVHWHGMLVPADVDGVEEQGTPFVPPQGRRRYQFTPNPAGSRWYHSHAMAYADLHKGSFTGQFGFVHIDSGNDPGQYDQELFLAIRDWEPFFTSSMEDDDEEGQNDPQLEKPCCPQYRSERSRGQLDDLFHQRQVPWSWREPIRVKEGQTCPVPPAQCECD